jgi:hypothetical protein
MTFHGLIISRFSPFVIDATLGDSVTSSPSVITLKLASSPGERLLPTDKMKSYQPDNTIDYKIRIVNPGIRPRGPRSFSIPDSLLKHK